MASKLRATPHGQVAAALRARRPGAVLEAEARALEQPLVDRAGNAAKRRDLALGQSRLAPSVLQRTTVQLHLQPIAVAAQHLRLEDLLAAGHAGEERRLEPREIVRRMPRERFTRRQPAAIDRLGEQRLGSRRADFVGQHVVHLHVDERAVLHLRDQVLAKVCRHGLARYRGGVMCRPPST
jgi:hypothetical protein